ncbi:hypothetical protein K432DRAFT_406818 [Lepidopterella palustris CBS 459.81]|uniref:Thioesterase domain-containing protein n=1 Tax=Lepidopterella palustris CBS 459.81 TaxID=1314670 RepID=A0A8E2E5Y8_9PEZI|nr:hypothetical protein K432DRAFT_406818 [Lepidopterella palustris CBS 459.81]
MPPLRPLSSSCIPIHSIKPFVLPKCNRVLQHRLNSTSGPASAPTPNPSSTPPPRKKPRSLRPLIWATICVAFGLGTGYIARSFAAPPPFPKPGSASDLKGLELLARDNDSLDIVKALRADGYHLHLDTSLDESGKGKVGWRELDVDAVSDIAASRVAARSGIEHSDAVKKDDVGKVTRTLTQQAMAGAGGLGIQRAFWNAATRELIAVVWFGGALSGWPGLVHGGAIATVLDEGLSRVVAGPDASLDTIPSPSSLTLTYRRPTQANRFYVLRASFSTAPTLPSETAPPMPSETPSAMSWLPPWKDLTKKPVPPVPEPNVEVFGTIEDLDGKMCVRAKATFPASAVRTPRP